MGEYARAESDDIGVLIHRYEELAITWGDERAARRANRLFDWW